MFGETDRDQGTPTKSGLIEAKIAAIESAPDGRVSGWQIVINKGALQGVEVGMLFRDASSTPKPITDPDTGETIGHVDAVRWRLTVDEVRDRIAICRITGVFALGDVRIGLPVVEV